MPGGAAAGAQGAGNINEIFGEAAPQQQKLVFRAPEQAERPQLVPVLCWRPHAEASPFPLLWLVLSEETELNFGGVRGRKRSPGFQSGPD